MADSQKAAIQKVGPLIDHAFTSMRVLFIIFLMSLFLSNCRNSKNRISSLINSQSTCDRIKGYELIGRYRDTSYLKDIFKDISDSKICLSVMYYGKSPLWAKVRALENITSIKLPYEYNTFTLDTTALVFYRKVLHDKGYNLE